MMTSNHRDDCRLCGSKKLQLVLPILPSPIGDAFVPSSKLMERQDLFSLETYLCNNCGHLQNLDIVDPDILFREYTYRSSVSLGLVDHFIQYSNKVIDKLKLNTGSLVVEMGSNDGSLLKAFKAHGMRVLGVDPAVSIASEATKQGIETIPDYFSLSLSSILYDKFGSASLFCANNVFAHIDNISDVADGICNMLSDDGVFVFEVSYLPDMIRNMVFDVIYHEHLSHHAIIPLEKFLNEHGLTLFDIDFISTKGGSMRGYAQKSSSGLRTKSLALKEAVAYEESIDIKNPKLYEIFFNEIEIRKQRVLQFLSKQVAVNKIIAAYGASTTTTTLLYHFELTKHIKVIFDDNTLKQGLYSPGAHIPVLAPVEIKKINPDVIVILAWIYADRIIKKNKDYIESGGIFVIPLPEFCIIDKSNYQLYN